MGDELSTEAELFSVIPLELRDAGNILKTIMDDGEQEVIVNCD